MHLVADLYAEVVGVVAQSRYILNINVLFNIVAVVSGVVVVALAKYQFHYRQTFLI